MRTAIIVGLLVLMPAAARAQSCPAVLADATRLALVTARGMQTSFARLALFTRKNPTAPWRQQDAPYTVRLGQNGLAWGAGFMHLAKRGEPTKRERDWRTPAGIYRIGAPFGFGRSQRPGYVRLAAGKTFCVDDLRSPAYNTVTTTAKAGRVRGERMWSVPDYRHGLFIDYPSNHAAPAGSCIFIHLSSGDSTAGCSAMPESRLLALQNFAEPGAVVAIVPQAALVRFKGCLP